MTRPQAFSLVEVVIAMGVFAVAAVAILGVLPVFTGEAGDAADRSTAQHLADALRVELQQTVHARGVGAAAGAIPVMSRPLEAGLSFVATREGLELQPVTGAPGHPSEFFLLEVWRFDREPLAYQPGAAVPLYVRVSWPYRLPGLATPVASRDRAVFTFTLALDP